MKRAALILAGIVMVLLGIGALIAPGSILGHPFKGFEKEWSIPAGELRNLQIFSDSEISVTFRESTDGSQSVYVKGHGTDKLANAVDGTRLEAGRLVVDLRRPNRFLPMITFFPDFGRPEQEVIVTLAPAYELDSLEVHIDSGSMDVRNVAVQAAEFTSDSGSITVDGISGPVKIQSDSGSIRLYKNDPSNTEIETDSGNVSIRLPASFAGSLDLKSDSGKITAPEAKNETQNRIRVRTDNGNIEIEQEE